MTLAKLLNFSYDSIDATDFETVLNKDAYVKMETQAKIKFSYWRFKNRSL